MKIPVTNKGDVNAASSFEFATLNAGQLMLSLNTYEAFALLNQKEAEELGNALLHFARTGRISRPLG